MSDDTRERSPSDARHETDAERGFWDRHAKLSILLIAGVFYVILIGMCLAVGLIIWRA